MHNIMFVHKLMESVVYRGRSKLVAAGADPLTQAPRTSARGVR